MAITVKHSKVSVVADGPDDGAVRPSDWNATHTLEQSGATLGQAIVWNGSEWVPGTVSGGGSGGSGLEQHFLLMGV